MNPTPDRKPVTLICIDQKGNATPLTTAIRDGLSGRPAWERAAARGIISGLTTGDLTPENLTSLKEILTPKGALSLRNVFTTAITALEHENIPPRFGPVRRLLQKAALETL